MKVLIRYLILLCCVHSSGLLLATSGRAQMLFQDTSKYENVLVDKVLSTDSFILEDGEKIRLIGLKAPEVPKKKKEFKRNEYNIIIREVDPLISVNERAFQFTQKLLVKKYVRLEFDVQRKDDDFYTLAYVFLEDDTFVNAEILRQGYASLRTIPPNDKYIDELRAAYQEARQEKRGLQGE
ncbi:MAG: thermonuclease family protein [Candidatus Omnitrophota bacterium]